MAYIDTDFKPEQIKKEDSSVTVEEKNKSTEPIRKAQTVNPAESINENNLKTSPAVRRIAEENSIDIRGIEGSGKEGRITKGDILDVVEKEYSEATKNIELFPAQKAGSETKEEKRQTIVKMSPIRRTIAKRLVQAKQEAAHFTTFNEINRSMNPYTNKIQR